MLPPCADPLEEPGVDPYVELEPWLPLPVLDEPLEGVDALAEPCDPLTEPCALVSVPVEPVEALPFVGVVVPCAVACVPAVDPDPDIDPDCEVPVSFPDVRVFLLLLLQANISAAASARPVTYLMWCLLKGLFAALFFGAPHDCRELPAACER